MLAGEATGQPADETEEKRQGVAFVAAKGQEEAAVIVGRRIGAGAPVLIYNGARRQVNAFAAGDHDLAPGDYAGGKVDDKGSVIAGRNAYRNWIGSQHALRATEGDHLRNASGSPAQCDHCDAASFCGLLGVLSQAADVGRVLECDAADG